MGTIAICILVIVFSVPLGGLAFLFTSQGDPLGQIEHVVRRWNYFDGWPYLLWFFLVGPTVAGPIAVRCSIGGFLSWPIVSGANLWQLLGLILLPKLVLALFTWFTVGQVAFALLWIVEFPIRALIIPAITGIVLLRYTFVFQRVVATHAWDPMLPSAVDYIGIGIGILWTIVSIREIYAYFTYGLVI